ncbi:MAG TPA: exo-alpha-sialidase [Thermoanaerobaculia bacterium]|nr:exo-alpha-sialidase [Thermoanaerobaculia bacterium]
MKVFSVMAAVVAVVVPGCGVEETVHGQVRSQVTKSGSVSRAVVEEIVVPATAGSAEPFLSTSRSGLLLSWLEPVAGSDRVALRFARYANGQWSAAKSVVERNDLFVNWADFPSIVEDARGTLFAHWLQKSGGGTYSYDVRMATSADGGATWDKPFLLNRDGTKTEHGFATLAALPDGGVGATWLDGRKMKAGGGHGGAGHEMGGDMTIRYATVRANGVIAGDTELDSRTCECCTTGMAMTTSGAVVVYRDRSSGEVRDISYVAQVRGRWSKPAKIHADEWKIDGCPVNGPQIDAMGNRAVTVWFTAAQEKGRAFAAFSDDGGATFGRAVQVDDGKPIGRLDVVLLDPDTALVTWLEQTARGGEIRARKVSRNGRVEPAIRIADSSVARASGFTRMAKVGPEVYFAWTEQSAKTKKIHVARGRF